MPTTFILLTFELETQPQISEAPKVYADVENDRLVFKCEFTSDTQEDVARFHISWYEEFPLKQLDKNEVINGTERVARLLLDSTSSERSPIFRLGKQVCMCGLTIHP